MTNNDSIISDTNLNDNLINNTWNDTIITYNSFNPTVITIPNSDDVPYPVEWNGVWIDKESLDLLASLETETTDKNLVELWKELKMYWKLKNG